MNDLNKNNKGVLEEESKNSLMFMLLIVIVIAIPLLILFVFTVAENPRQIRQKENMICTGVIDQWDVTYDFSYRGGTIYRTQATRSILLSELAISEEELFESYEEKRKQYGNDGIMYTMFIDEDDKVTEKYELYMIDSDAKSLQEIDFPLYFTDSTGGDFVKLERKKGFDCKKGYVPVEDRY